MSESAEEKKDAEETYEEWKARVSKFTTKEEIQAEINRLKASMFDSGVPADVIRKIEEEAEKAAERHRGVRGWLTSDKLPRFLLKWFQLFLIAQKLFGMQPFGSYSWWLILLPTIVSAVCDIAWLSSLPEKDLDEIIAGERKKLKDTIEEGEKKLKDAMKGNESGKDASDGK